MNDLNYIIWSNSAVKKLDELKRENEKEQARQRLTAQHAREMVAREIAKNR